MRLDPKHQSVTSIPHVLLVALLLSATLIVVSLSGCGAAEPEPPDLEPSATEPVPDPEPVPDLEPTPYFETTGATTSESDALGELDVEYPFRMSPESSDTVILSMYMPARLASVKPMSVERVQIPADVPAIVGELSTFRTTVLIAEVMRAELSSPGLSVENIHPAEQSVDTQQINRATSWAWTIQAPRSLGRQVFTVKVYLRQDTQPSWVGSFQVEIVEAAPVRAAAEGTAHTPAIEPTSTPEPTPLPPFTRAMNDLLDNSATVFAAVLSFIAAMFGIYIKKSKTGDKA